MWNFDNTYVELPRTFYKDMELEPVSEPKLVKFNSDLAKELGLETELEAGFFTGNLLPDGAQPIAQAYAGHQFGYFNMLGDGRAVLLGEQIAPDGKRMDIQLKGSGRTPYSRGGDGRAALGPMLREYLISEAMYGLGIPTTRSLAVASTGDITLRERPLPGAILTRVAASHLRVGTFEYGARWATDAELKALAEYAIDRHYPNLSNSESYLPFLQEVAKRQAELIAKWQLVGFVHGVMNTDNVAISGETIDYGPCAFLDTYDPETAFSSIDEQGRYAYGNQPYIGAWNLARLVESLSKFITREEAESVIGHYWEVYNQSWLDGMAQKLGLFASGSDHKELILSLLDFMKKLEADYTNTFVALMSESELPGFEPWIQQWKNELDRQPQSWEESRQLMNKVNPKVIPRNHKVEEALMLAEHGDMDAFDRMLAAVQNPYEEALEYMKPAEKGVCYQTFCGT